METIDFYIAYLLFLILLTLVVGLSSDKYEFEEVWIWMFLVSPVLFLILTFIFFGVFNLFVENAK